MNYRKPFEACSPEEVGIRSEDILSYIEALEASQTEMHGLMIMRHGKLCAQGWWAPFGPNVRHGLQSHTKTYAATAVGIAYTEGLLRLNERLIDIFPEESPAQPSENLKLLTVRDVLCMGCGMDTMPFNSPDWIREFLHTPVNHKPGTTYMYNSTGSTLLGAIVRKKTGLGLHDYLTPRLFNKIGVDPDNLRWMCMADGMEVGGGGLFATTEDNFRLMKLYADGGVWEGERILSEDYVKLATTNQNDSATESLNNPEATDNFLGYGFQIWMCKPKGAYRADGAMGQFTIVLPEQDMIIGITETAVGAHWAQSTLDITWDFLDRITDSEPLPEDEAASIALHIVNAEFSGSMNATMRAAQVLRPIVEILLDWPGLKLNTRHIYYDELIVHIKFLAMQSFSDGGEDWADPEILGPVTQRYPQALACAEEIVRFLAEKSGNTIPAAEQAYLALCIRRACIN